MLQNRLRRMGRVALIAVIGCMITMLGGHIQAQAAVDTEQTAVVPDTDQTTAIVDTDQVAAVVTDDAIIPEEPVMQPEENVIISARIPEVQVLKGKRKQITIEGANAEDFIWESANSDVVQVTSSGAVKGISVGTAIVTARNEERFYEYQIKVFASMKYVNKWVTIKGRCYHYDEYGQKAIGRTKIGSDEYFFDSKGRQRVGWIEDGGNYYFYNVSRKGNGYLRVNETINGIRLKANGSAKVTKNNKEKIQMYVYASESVFENTDWTMTRTEMLKTMFLKLARDEIISYKTIGHFRNIKKWDEYYANQYFSTGYGDCYTYASAMAYFAIALGYENVYVCSSGKHGWCQIDGLYYDPRFANWGTSHEMDAFAVPEELCGKGGRMNWKRWSTYICKVD